MLAVHAVALVVVVFTVFQQPSCSSMAERTTPETAATREANAEHERTEHLAIARYHCNSTQEPADAIGHNADKAP